MSSKTNIEKERRKTVTNIKLGFGFKVSRRLNAKENKGFVKFTLGVTDVYRFLFSE